MFPFFIFSQENEKDVFISMDIKGWNILQVLEKISENHSFQFVYAAGILDNSTTYDITFTEEPLEQVLSFLLKNQGLYFIIERNTIIIKKRKESLPSFGLEGLIKSETGEPIPFATIQVKNRNMAAMADKAGMFSLSLPNGMLHDSLMISTIGYKRKCLLLADVLKKTPVIVTLEEEIYQIPPVHVRSKDFKTVRLGNTKRKPKGSLYVDTHGQQFSFFIKNDDYKLPGIIRKVSFYLDKEGNVEVPFRVRVYKQDSITGKPGKDLLTHVVIVKPGTKGGWFSVPLTEYNIEMPANGAFFAIEGIYPDDYSKEFEYQENDSSTNFSYPEEELISYGQRLGYTHAAKNENDSWFYSMSRNWFQLKKQPCALMIHIEVQYRKNEKHKK